MPPRRRPVDESERKQLLRRILDLPERDRLTIFVDLRGYLAAELGEPDLAEEDILGRRRALLDLEKAAEDLRARGKLGDGEAPTANLYGQTAKELGLSTSTATLIRLFGLWRNAQAALLGNLLPEGPAARRIKARRAARKNETVDQMDGLREWLATEPADTDRADYDAFAKEANKSFGKNIYSASGSITSTLMIDWEDALEVARGNTSVVKARERRLEKEIEGLSDSDPIGSGTAALILGLTPQDFLYETATDGFPVAVVDLPNVKGWLLGDMRTFASGQDAPRRKPGELNDQIMLSRDIAKRLAISPDYLRTCLSVEKWSRVPKPNGRIGISHYWWRNQAENWIYQRETA